MKKAKGTFWTRFSLLLLAASFGMLTYWSVGFLLDDIWAIDRPDRQEFFDTRTDKSLKSELSSLEMKRTDLNHQHDLLNQQREFIKDSSESLKITVDNLFNLKNKDQALISESQFGKVLATLDKIIAIQDEFKETAERYLQITNERFELSKQIKALEARIEEERRTIQDLYNEAWHDHRVKTTFLQLALLIPLAIACTALLVKTRKSHYRMIFRATALAIYIYTTLVIQANFPERYFKYIMMTVMLVLVGWGFVWLIRRLVKPQVEALLMQ